jgi:hypothetical protein
MESSIILKRYLRCSGESCQLVTVQDFMILPLRARLMRLLLHLVLGLEHPLSLGPLGALLACQSKSIILGRGVTPFAFGTRTVNERFVMLTALQALYFAHFLRNLWCRSIASHDRGAPSVDGEQSCPKLHGKQVFRKDCDVDSWSRVVSMITAQRFSS